MFWVTRHQWYVVIFWVVLPAKQPKPFHQLVNAWHQVEEVLTEARAVEVLGGFLSYWLVDCKVVGVKLLVRFAQDITNRFDS